MDVDVDVDADVDVEVDAYVEVDVDAEQDLIVLLVIILPSVSAAERVLATYTGIAAICMSHSTGAVCLFSCAGAMRYDIGLCVVGNYQQQKSSAEELST